MFGEKKKEKVVEMPLFWVKVGYKLAKDFTAEWAHALLKGSSLILKLCVRPLKYHWKQPLSRELLENPAQVIFPKIE